MSTDENVTRLEDRVRELQTAVATMIRHLGLETQVTAAERARLDEVRVKGDAPTQHLSEVYEDQQLP